MSRTNLHGTKDVRVVEVRLYVSPDTIRAAHMHQPSANMHEYVHMNECAECMCARVCANARFYLNSRI